MDMLLWPFQLPFMQNAFWVTLMIAPAAGLLSCFLVLKGWSLIGDATAHAVLPGVVLAYVSGLPLLLGAYLAALFCALAAGFIDEHSRVKKDTVLGVVFSGMFGLGVVIYTQIESDLHLDHILFGNILGVGGPELWTTGIIATGVTAVLLLFWKDILAHAFDPVQAKMVGLRVDLIHYGLLTLLAAIIVAMLSSVGIILAIGFLIAPGAIAFLLTRRMTAMLALSVGVAVFSGVAGIYASFWLDSAPAATIVLVMTVLFLAALVIKSVRSRKATLARP